MENQQVKKRETNKNNIQQQVGSLGKVFLNTTKSGFKIANFSISVATGFDEESKKFIYSYFDWKALGDDCDLIMSLPERQRVKIAGTPGIEEFTNKQGVSVRKQVAKMIKIEVMNYEKNV